MGGGSRALDCGGRGGDGGGCGGFDIWACWMLRTTLFGASAIVCKYGSFQVTLKATIQSGGKTWMKIGYNFMGYQVLVR